MGFFCKPIDYCVEVVGAPIGAAGVHEGGALVALANRGWMDAEAGEEALEVFAWARRRPGKRDGAAVYLEADGAGEVQIRGEAGAEDGCAEGVVIAAGMAMDALGAGLAAVKEMWGH